MQYDSGREKKTLQKHLHMVIPRDQNFFHVDETVIFQSKYCHASTYIKQ